MSHRKTNRKPPYLLLDKNLIDLRQIFQSRWYIEGHSVSRSGSGLDSNESHFGHFDVVASTLAEMSKWARLEWSQPVFKVERFSLAHVQLLRWLSWENQGLSPGKMLSF